MTELNFTNYIYDNIHGYIALTDIENDIEKLPIFQRLRRLKQLGVANWIFPGAEHTRYSHSLGVMHIADQMAIKLNFKSEERQLIRIAGLLHDIGHYPLSHVGESAYKNYCKQDATKPGKISRESINNIAIKKIDSLNNDKPDLTFITDIYMRPSENEFHHEKIGTLVIKNNKAICELLVKANIDVEDVCSIIVGDISKKELIKFVQLLHSEFDADRIDYLLRDASSSGTSYGLFELSTVLKSLMIKTDVKYDVDIVGIGKKGIASMDQFLLSRYFAYSQVVFNKYVSVLNYMAETVMYYFINTSDNIFPDGKNLIKHIEEQEDNDFYLNFTDNFFVEKLKNMDFSIIRNCPVEVKKMIELLKQFRAPNIEEPKNINNFVLSGQNSKKIFRKIKEIGFEYSDSLKGIIKCEEVFLTKNIKLDDYKKIYKDLGNELEDIELDEYLKHRLINGVAVLNDNNDIHLLVDEPSSIIKDLCRHRTIFVRKYAF